MSIRAKLRDGSEYVLLLEATDDAAIVFTEIAAGRSQALRGWVAVEPLTAEVDDVVVLGDHIVELHLLNARGQGRTRSACSPDGELSTGC